MKWEFLNYFSDHVSHFTPYAMLTLPLEHYELNHLQNPEHIFYLMYWAQLQAWHTEMEAL